VDTQWTLTGLGIGSVSVGSAIQFSGIDNVLGGTAGDNFEIVPTGGLSGNLNGGTGTGLNSLSYAQYTTDVTVNLAVATAGNASAISGITSNFTIVMGGSGNDTLTGNSSKSSVLVGNAGNDTLLGGSARDILIGGIGSDTISGVSGDDILIAGRTQHDSSRTALLSILAEWSTTLRNFSQRTNNLFGGTGDRLNGANYLNSETVFADPESVDSLLGGLGQDWFFAELAEINDFNSSGNTPDRRD
jgi:Ca2+-binding RTX toxin-like protein